MSCKSDSIQIDQWIWGTEKIIWGFAPEHRYTFKLLEPKKGRVGCLSLQYHDQKSETWLILRGIAWALLVIEGRVCTRIMRPGDGQNISPGMIHRLMAISDDLQVLEPSTPDQHAADKTAKKDVVRLHCVHGRPVLSARSPEEAAILEKCISLTENAISAIEQNRQPIELELKWILQHGGFRI